MEIVWLIALVVGLVVIALVLRTATRSMRPKLPEPPAVLATPRAASGVHGATPLPASAVIPPRVAAEIDALVAAGQRAKAVRVLRQHTNFGLKEAKDRIDHWSATSVAPQGLARSHATAVSSSIAAPHSSITSAHASGSVRSTLPPSVVSDIDRLVAGGQKIAAIKVVRQHTGWGLKESKEQIDRWDPQASR